MSLVNSDVDLSALARAETSVPPPRRSWIRVLLPLVILAAFGAILWSTARDLFVTRPVVELVRPTRLLGERASAARAPRVAVQAAGWVEPDPFPIYASALAGGVVSEVLVQESDEVTAGAPLARMVPEDAELARDAARAEVDRLRAALEGARARAIIAAERFDAALEVTEANDRATAVLAAREAAAEHRRAAVSKGEAEVSLAESEIVVQRELAAAGASGVRQVEIAEANLVSARATLRSLRAEADLAEADRAAAEAAATRAAEDLELRFADRLERDVSAAEADRVAGELGAAETALAEAELRLARMAVVAPTDGVVLERLAAPGEELKPGAPVASLYDPARLRVRVDVPQSDVESLTVGMAAEVQSESRPGRPYPGEVIRIVQRADIQKVTLEAQVRIADADGLLRPDMLTQVRFLSPEPETAAPGEADGGAAALGVPEELIRDGGVWVYDPVDGVARRRAVEVVGAAVDGVVAIAPGALNLTDKLIDPMGQRLEDGARVDARSGAGETR